MIILQIKRKWFDMILSGEKKEEYRDIKPYYTSRFPSDLKDFYVTFRNGYSKNAPFFVARCSLRVGFGKAEWGAEPDTKYFILEILELIK